MQEEVVTVERPHIGYAQPLSRLQVSWGSILAGAISTLAVGLILWLLAMSIILTATRPSMSSIRGALLAAWITGMVCTIIASFVGGAVAGYLPGNPRRAITVAHGFLSWCAAFLLASLVQLAVIGGFMRTTTQAVMTTASTAVQTTGQAVGGAVSGQGDLQRKAEDVLTSLGYSTDEARAMVNSAQAELQHVLRGRQPVPGPQQAAAQARGALDSVFAAAAVYTWLSFATWVLSAVASVLGARWVLQRVRLVPEREHARDDLEFPPHLPMRPVPQTR